MRWLNLTILCGLAVVLAAGNLWFSAARSTIPLSLDDRVERVEMRREKHPGQDDVYLAHLQSGRPLQIDSALAKRLEPKAVIRKRAWEHQIDINSRKVALGWSADARGMAQAMPAALLVLLATAMWVWLRRDKAAAR